MARNKKGNKDFQREQMEKLRSGELAHNDASIYTILFELVDGNGIEDVFMLLHNLAFDIGEAEKLEKELEKSKKWEWVKPNTK